MDGSNGESTILQQYLLARDIYYGWFVIAGCFLGLFTVFGMITSFSVFFGHIVGEFNLSHANTSIIFSLQIVSTYGSLSILGFFVDRYAVSRLVLIGAGLVGGGLIGAGTLGSFVGVAVSYGLLAGIGFGLTMIIAYTTPVMWFGRRRGLASGIAISGGGMGMLVLPPLSEWLIDGFGWQKAYLLLGVAIFLIIVFSGRLVVDRPSSLGVDPSAEFPDGDIPEVKKDTSALEQVYAVKQIVLSTPFVLMTLSFLAAYTPHYALSVHFVEYLQVNGIGRTTGVLALSVLGISNVSGKFLAGYIADLSNPTTVLGGAAAICGLSVTAIALVQRPVLVLALTVFYGIGLGGIGSVLSLVAADLFGTVNLNAVFGVSAISYMIAGSVAPFAAGYTFDHLGNYTPAFIVSGCIGITAAGLVFAAKRLRSPIRTQEPSNTST